MKKYIIFYVNKEGLRDHVIVDAVDFKNKRIPIHKDKALYKNIEHKHLK